MFDLLDRYLLSRPPPRDEQTIVSRRFDGPAPDNFALLVFLPWNTPFWLARRLRLVGDRFTACYELASAIASSLPDLSVMALKWIVRDAQTLLASERRPVIVVGYSLGTYPAIYLANLLKARVYAVAPADRGDLMIWQSPAAAAVRRRAEARGLELHDYEREMRGYNPVDNLQGLAKGSAFFMGDADPFIPAERSQGLVSAARQDNRDIRLVTAPGGHLRTLIHGANFIRTELSSATPHKSLGQLDYQEKVLERRQTA